jgi:hypothetical protein
MSAENEKQRALKPIEAVPDDATLEDAIERFIRWRSPLAR